MRRSSNRLPAILLTLYILIRIVSLCTWQYPLLNALMALALIIPYTYITIKNEQLSWAILLGEIVLDGSGHFFVLGGLLLRTWFLGIFALRYAYTVTRKRVALPSLPRPIMTGLVLVGITIFLAAVRGILFGHGVHLVVQDTILFFFYFFLFPFLHYREYRPKFYMLLGQVFLLGTGLTSLLTLLWYGYGFGVLQDGAYHWFRDVAGGKITDLGYHFFRIVLPEHLYIVPAILIIAALLMKSPANKKLWLYQCVALFVLAVNWTRMYMIALAVGFLILASREHWKRWLAVASLTAVSLFVIFLMTHTIMSGGASFGFELIGFKTSGIVAPESDVSGAIRLALLPDIFRTIGHHPILGSGLSTSVTFVHPVTKAIETRTQFDWGYLELVTNLGILGTLIYIGFIASVWLRAARQAFGVLRTTPEGTLLRALCAGLVAITIMNLTSPALFQGFGILYIVFLLTKTLETEQKSL